MNFLSVLYAKAGITVDGVTTLNNTATGQTPATNDNSTKLATTGYVKNQNYYPYPTGTTSQYVRGDGSLATFTQTGGGGSSVNYYLNGSVSQGTIGGNAYYEMSKTAIIGTNADFSINADGYVAQFVTDAGDPALLNIPGGNWNFEMFFSASSGGGSPSFYVELYKYNGTTLTLIASGSAVPESITGGTAIDLYLTSLAVPTTTLTLTDRLAIRVYVLHSGRTITLHTQDSHLCQVITSFTTGLTALNGLTAQVQNFAVGAGGSDFNISSVVDTHTFNLPTASATKRGALSSIDWSAFDAKVDFGDLSATAPLNYNGSGLFTIAQSSGSTNGYLSSTDWTTFNAKIGGSGTANYVAKFTSGSVVGNSIIYDNGTNVGIGTTNPNSNGGASATVVHINGVNSGDWAVTHYTNNNTGSAADDGTVVGVIGSSGDMYIFNYENSSIILATNSNERMRIAPSGNILIGTTSGSFPLTVVGKIGANIFADSYLEFPSNGHAILKANNDVFVGYSQNFVVKQNGYVGVGTTNPLYRLESTTTALFGTTAYGVLNIAGDNPAYIKIKTNIPFSYGAQAYTVNIKGFQYGSAQTLDLQVCWHQYTDAFYSQTITSKGSFAPVVRLARESGLVVIVLTWGQYWPKLYVESVHNYLNDGYANGWTWVDENVTGDKVATLSYKNDFGDGFVKTAAGLVGIGTNNPTQKLDVIGQAAIGSGAQAIVGTDGTYAGYSTIGFGGTTNGYNRVFGNSGTADGLYLAAATSQGIWFWTNGANTRMHITPSGNVLINTTTDAGYKLDVNGTIRAQDNIIVDAGNNKGFTLNAGLAIYRVDGNHLGLFSASIERVRINASGNVSIGSTGDNTGKLQIYGDAYIYKNAEFLASVAVNSGESQYQTWRNSVGTRRGYFGFPTGSSNDLVLHNETGGIIGLYGGNVLIGTTVDAGYKLDVNGTARISAGLTATKTAKDTYGIEIKGGFYGAPRLQIYDLAVDGNAFLGLGTDMSGGSYEFSNYFPRYSGLGRWSVGSWAGAFGTGQYVSGYNEKLWINESSAAFNIPLNVVGALTQSGNQVLHAGNYNSYSPTLTGVGATGTWGISISGNAATATSAGSSAYSTNLSNQWINNGTTFISTYNSLGNSRASFDFIYNTSDMPLAGGLYSVIMNKNDNDYGAMLALNTEPNTGTLYTKVRYGGSWYGWKTILDSGNFNSYAATVGHTHDLGRYSLQAPAYIDGLTAANFRSTLFGLTSNTFNISAARWNTTPTALPGMNSYGTMMAWSGADTQGFIATDYNGANITVGGGNGNNIVWTALLVHSLNIGSQSVAYAANAGTLGTYAETSFIRIAVNSSLPTNANFAMGQASSRNFIQSHAGQPLDLNPLGNAVTINGYTPITSNNIGSQSVSSAATATNISNNGTVTLATATESNSIYITQPSYSTDQPVKLLNFDWYGEVWQMGNIRSSGATTAGFGIYLNGSEKFRFNRDGEAIFQNRVTTTAWTTTGRNYSNEWIEFPNFSGLYSPNNGAHFYPNNSSYGSWKVVGQRNGWGGLEFEHGVAGNTSLMIGGDSNQTGFHNNSYGWQFMWQNGTLFVFKGSYGAGTQATVLDSSNVGSYAVKLYGTITGNIDSDYGECFVTFDPIPSGTPPLSSPNIRTINVGNSYSRRTQLAFDYASDTAFFRRRTEAGWFTWREFIHSGNIGSQSVAYAANAGTLTSMNISQFTNNSGYITSASLAGYLPLTGGTLTGDLTTSGWFINSTDTYGIKNSSNNSSFWSQYARWNVNSNDTTSVSLAFYTQYTQQFSIGRGNEGIYITNDQDAEASILCYQGAGYGGYLTGTWNVTNDLTVDGDNIVVNNSATYATALITHKSSAVAFPNSSIWESGMVVDAISSLYIIKFSDASIPQAQFRLYETGRLYIKGDIFSTNSNRDYTSSYVRLSGSTAPNDWFVKQSDSAGFSIIKNADTLYGISTGGTHTFSNPSNTLVTFSGSAATFSTSVSVIAGYISVGAYGLSSSTYSAFIRRNDASSYGAWELVGAKGGYTGMYYSTSNQPHIMFGTSNGHGGLYYQTGSRWVMYYDYTNNSLGIGGVTTDATYRLYVNGNVRVVGTFNLSTLITNGAVYSIGGGLTNTNPSDIRLKEDISPLQYGLKEVMALKPVTYKWKDGSNNGQRSTGLIAQDVKEVMPDYVKNISEDSDFLGLDSAAINIVLINAIKELQAEIEILKNK